MIIVIIGIVITIATLIIIIIPVIVFMIVPAEAVVRQWEKGLEKEEYTESGRRQRPAAANINKYDVSCPYHQMTRFQTCLGRFMLLVARLAGCLAGLPSLLVEMSGLPFWLARLACRLPGCQSARLLDLFACLPGLPILPNLAMAHPMQHLKSWLTDG